MFVCRPVKTKIKDLLEVEINDWQLIWRFHYDVQCRILEKLEKFIVGATYTYQVQS